MWLDPHYDLCAELYVAPMELKLFFHFQCYRHVAPMGLWWILLSMDKGFFRPYRARNVFHLLFATNLLPLRGNHNSHFYDIN